MLRSHPLRTLITVAIGLALATTGCAGESSTEEETVPAEGELQASTALTIAFDDAGALFVPAFGTDPERYRGPLQLQPQSVFEVENRGRSPRTITVDFNGPPMLDPAHEVHLSTTIELAPGRSRKLHAPDSRGRYSFRCPTADDGFTPCAGITLSDGSGEWRPRILVVGSLF